MADFSKVTKKKGLGVPPAIEDTKGNLENPEVAPIASQKTKNALGRPKSNRTAKITTTLTPEFKKRLQVMSVESGRNMGDIIEEAVIFWESNHK